MGLSTSLNTAIAGLNATQIGIGVVSSNVANADKVGYVRRTVGTSDTYNGNIIGTNTAQVQRLLDQVVQRQLWQESSGAAYTSTRADALTNLDRMFGAPGSSTALDSVYGSFTSSLQALQNDPSSFANRTAVLDAASQLADQLNRLSDGVQSLRMDAEAGIADAVTKTNELLDALTGINARIVGSGNDGSTVGLKDQRDLILAELSQYVDIRTSEDANGSLSIITASGVQLFDNRPTVKFGFDARSSISPESQWSANAATRGVGTVTMTDSSGNSSDAIANRTFRSGEIAAFVELRDKTLVQAQAQLDEIAAQLSSALSDREVAGTVTTAAPASQVDLDFNLGALERGNSLTFDYKATPGGQTQRLTFVDVSAAATLPASAAGDANNRVVKIDFSGGTAASVAAIQAAITTTIGPGFTVSNPASPSGNLLRIVDDGAGNTRDVVGLTARPTTTSLTSVSGGSAELPFFVDGGLGNAAFTGSFETGSQAVGFAARITVNRDLVADRSKLVVSNTSPATAQGDNTRPALLLSRLTESQRSFTRSTGMDGNTTTSSSTISNFVQRVVSSQGQAVDAAKRLDEGQQIALASVQSRFQETSKVTVDQEMSLLIELQTAYAANARVISTVKELMDVLLRV